MKWEVIPRRENCCAVKCGETYLDTSGRLCELLNTFSEYSARANAAYANENGPWPEGHEKCPKPDWDAASEREQKDQLKRFGWSIPVVASLMDMMNACSYLRFRWGKQCDGPFYVVSASDDHSYGKTLAIALCKALDAREGKP